MAFFSFVASPVRRYFSTENNHLKHVESMRANLKLRDFPQYFGLHFLPRNARAGILTLATLHLEIGEFEKKQQSLLRLQWWNDTIECVYKNKNVPQGVPLVSILDQLIHHYKIKKVYFDYYLNAKSLAESGYGPLFSLYLQVIASSTGITLSKEDLESSQHLGLSYTIFRNILSLRNNVISGKPLAIPKVKSDGSNLAEFVFELACTGKNHLDSAKMSDLSKNVKLLYLPTIVLRDFYTELENVNFEITKLSELTRLKISWRMIKEWYLIR